LALQPWLERQAMLDHVSIGVSDFARSKAFYEQALKPLGITVVMGDGRASAGFGDTRPFFWIGQADGAVSERVHVAFTAASRAAVDAFYAAALAAGGLDNGPPGLRLHYHPSYYGAFVHDPDGHNIEAVCHSPV
jgi:catechol 2,3-dioxygenase-like lactoylglutathione lyase family enzyme